MMSDEDPPEFEHDDHVKLWEKIHENSEAIAALDESMDWVKRIVIAILVGIIITFLGTILG